MWIDANSQTLSGLRGNVPSFVAITDGKARDVNILDALIPEPGAVYVMTKLIWTLSGFTACTKMQPFPIEFIRFLNGAQLIKNIY